MGRDFYKWLCTIVAMMWLCAGSALANDATVHTNDATVHPIGATDNGEETTQASAAPAPTKPPDNVYIGLYLRDVSGFDLNEGRFQADLDVWMKWLGPEQIPHIQFVNAEISSREEVARENDGDWRSIRWRIQGTFRGEFPVHNFPFDTQHLSLDFQYPTNGTTLKPDLAGSGMSSSFSSTGWIFEPFFQVKTGTSTQHSDFGSIHNEGKPHEMQEVDFVLELSRPFASYVVKFLLPLSIILIMACLAFWIPPNELEVRSAVGVTALLSCIAFHFSQADSLPDVPYLVSADKFFLGAYVLILASLVISVIASNTWETRPKATERMDRIGRPLIPALAVIGSLVALHIPDTSAAVSQSQGHLQPVASKVGAFDQGDTKASHSDPLKISLLSSERSRTGLTHKPLIDTFVDPNGESLRLSWFLEEIPQTSNTLVRFLPQGGMSVRWQLRPGLKWGDGAPMTSEDLAFSIEVSPSLNPKAVNVLSKTAIEVIWPDREKRYLGDFTLYPAHSLRTIFEAEGYEGVKQKLRTDPPARNGPYLYQGENQEGYRVYTRNPYFVGQVGMAKEIWWCAEKESACRNDPSQFDILTNVSENSTLKTFAPMGHWDVHRTQRAEQKLMYLDLADGHPVLGELEVRTALIRGIDRERARAIFYSPDASTLANGFTKRAPDRSQMLAYDPTLARTLVRKHRRKLHGKIELICLDYTVGPYAELCAGLAKDLTDIGIPIEIKRVGSTTQTKIRDNRKFDGILVENVPIKSADTTDVWGMTDIDGAAQRDELKGAYGPEERRLFERIRTSLYSERREMLQDQLEGHYFTKLPTIPLFTGSANALKRPTFRGWDPTRNSDRFWNIEHWHTVPPE